LVQPHTWGIVRPQQVLVITVFAAVNARYLVAGHALARARGTVTYAQYLHAGFAQLSLAAFLAVVMVIVGHRLLHARGGGAGTAVPGGAWLTTLELTLLLLSGVALASCWQRLHVYEVAYGYTYLRMGVEIAQLAALCLLVLTAVKAARRSWRGWAASVTASAFAFVVLVPWLDADLLVARGNVERAALARAGEGDPFAWAELDVAYLADLSEDARPALAHPLFRQSPELAADIERAWAARAAPRTPGWRGLRGLGGRR
jgi:hypothetical protein